MGEIHERGSRYWFRRAGQGLVSVNMLRWYVLCGPRSIPTFQPTIQAARVLVQGLLLVWCSVAPTRYRGGGMGLAQGRGGNDVSGLPPRSAFLTFSGSFRRSELHYASEGVMKIERFPTGGLCLFSCAFRICRSNGANEWCRRAGGFNPC